MQTDGIVGGAFIQIGGGTDDARMVEPGETITGVDPIAFADLIEEGRETFRTRSSATAISILPVGRSAFTVSAGRARTAPLTATTNSSRTSPTR